MKKKIIEPVSPSSMDIILTYVCPTCNTPVSTVAPVYPIRITCPECKEAYPIIPADALSIQYLRLMFANGGAIINADFA